MQNSIHERIEQTKITFIFSPCLFPFCSFGVVENENFVTLIAYYTQIFFTLVLFFWLLIIFWCSFIITHGTECSIGCSIRYANIFIFFFVYFSKFFLSSFSMICNARIYHRRRFVLCFGIMTCYTIPRLCFSSKKNMFFFSLVLFKKID